MEFFKTSMGRKLFESDVPDLISVLSELTIQLKRHNAIEEKKFALNEKLIKLQIKEHNKNNKL